MCYIMKHELLASKSDYFVARDLGLTIDLATSSYRYKCELTSISGAIFRCCSSYCLI